MLSIIKSYQSETGSQRSPSCCTSGCLFTKRSFVFDLQLPCLFTFTRNALVLLTGWFGGPSKPTKWIKKKPVSWFGWFWTPAERWKETAPWKRKFKFSVKSISASSPASVLNLKMGILKVRVRQPKFFFIFLNLVYQNEKIEGEWTDLPQRNIPPPHRMIWNQKYFDSAPKPKIPKFQLPLILVGCVLCQVFFFF